MNTCVYVVLVLLVFSGVVRASDRLSILEYGAAGTTVDNTGVADASTALAAAVSSANSQALKNQPACVYIPGGTYRIKTPPPAFVRAGCVIGDGPSQSTLLIDPQLEGDIFSWSEAWEPTAPGPMVIGLKIQGSRAAVPLQNGLVFYDRNDRVFIDNVEIDDLHGRALYSGVTKSVSEAYMRESHIRSLRFFKDGAPDVPVIEFNSQGTEKSDATNEIRMSQVDIYGSYGPSFVIRNNGRSAIRFITVDALRIEGLQNSAVKADLLTIGDPVMTGNVNNVVLTSIELIDPYKGYAAIRITAPEVSKAPYQITLQGIIGGGSPNGQGLRIDAGRTSTFRFAGIHTFDTNVVIGRGVSQIVLDGGGQETAWTYSVDPTSENGLQFPTWRTGLPNQRGPAAN